MSVPRSRQALGLIAPVVVFVAAGAAFLLRRTPLASAEATVESPAATRDTSGTELQLVLLVSSSCGQAREASFQPLVLEMVAAVRRRAAQLGLVVVTTLAVTDEDPITAWRFAQSLGHWDEFSLGRGWRNALVERFIWDVVPGPAAVPQVLLLERQIDSRNNALQFGPMHLLSRNVGSGEMRTWLDTALPF